MSPSAQSSNSAVRIVTVCICTYKRPQLLRRALEAVAQQHTNDSIRFSIVVVDNDASQSGKEVVLAFAAARAVETIYAVEPEQNIALARNRALANARGDFVAFIDDDEFPCRDWLLLMLKNCEETDVAGVLGPVRPFFDRQPPAWLVRGKFCERPELTTGSLLKWRQTRTGNVLFRKEILEEVGEPFRRGFSNGGEDQDFFKRMMENGHRFIWCNEAVVYEVVPPERWKRRYVLKRALLRGQNERLFLNARSLAKSTLAVLLYGALLPFLLFLGQHVFMNYAAKLVGHLGKLISALGIRPMGKKYIDG